jgi:hypothetical protein
MSGLFAFHGALMFDYYGVGAQAISYMDDLVRRALDKGKCAIGFDHLQIYGELGTLRKDR